MINIDRRNCKPTEPMGITNRKMFEQEEWTWGNFDDEWSMSTNMLGGKHKFRPYLHCSRVWSGREFVGSCCADNIGEGHSFGKKQACRL